MANIIVIDDEAVLLELISLTLRLDGHKVVTFDDPLLLFESFCAGHTPIDLLLTDVNMRPVNGVEVVRRLVLKGFCGPVVFMSGYSYLESSFAGTSIEPSVIDKPFTASQLRSVVRTALGRKMAKACQLA